MFLERPEMKKLAIAAALAVAVTSPVLAAESAPAAAPAAAYSTEATDIGTLIDNAATKAVLDKHLPGFAGNPQIEMARGMTLVDIQQYAADVITDAKLAAIDADLAKLGK